jgi:hypothetical protein
LLLAIIRVICLTGGGTVIRHPHEELGEKWQNLATGSGKEGINPFQRWQPARGANIEQQHCKGSAVGGRRPLEIHENGMVVDPKPSMNKHQTKQSPLKLV